MISLSLEAIVILTKEQLMQAAKDLERAANNLKVDDPPEYVQDAIGRTYNNLHHTLVRYTEYKAVQKWSDD